MGARSPAVTMSSVGGWHLSFSGTHFLSAFLISGLLCLFKAKQESTWFSISTSQLTVYLLPQFCRELFTGDQPLLQFRMLQKRQNAVTQFNAAVINSIVAK